MDSSIFTFWEISKVIVEKTLLRGQKITYLPRMDINNNIPANSETLVIISTLISSPEDITKLKDKLISHHFSNISDNLKICALCDLKQANYPSIAEDKTLVRNATRIVKKLNEKYNDRFYLVIRNRTFSKTQGVYTGYERKRGAIEQLIRYIKGENVKFISFVGDEDFIHKVKYIISLDYDTKPLLDTIPELVSIALHPLNKPVIGDRRVIKGYGIIVPRMTTILKSSLKSPFSKLVGGVGSSCAYDSQSSDLYQDSFDEGIFAGKGLINVDTFHKLCLDIFPPEEVLSHDILEGELMRTAYAGDIEFRDNFPPTMLSYFKRLHRWIRGDIQNITFSNKKLKAKMKSSKTHIAVFPNIKLLIM